VVNQIPAGRGKASPPTAVRPAAFPRPLTHMVGCAAGASVTPTACRPGLLRESRSSATFVSEVGNVARFDNPRQLMACLGLVPSERSTGYTVRRGGVTKAGNRRVRHLLVESAWTYRHPPKIGIRKLYILGKVPSEVRATAWQAQTG
jgi:Transposase IS116/IS110/IS902 family